MLKIPVLTEESEQPPNPRAISHRMTLSAQVSFADLSKAQQFRSESGLRILTKSQKFKPYPICTTDLKALGQYGVGLELYFLLIKQLAMLFLIISLLSTWPLYENYSGHGLGSVYQGQLYSYFSVANQESFEYELDLQKARNLIPTLKTNALYLSIADGVYTIMALLFILNFDFASKKKSRDSLVDNVTVRHYAVEVKGFPRKNIKVEKIKEHFSRYGDVAEVSLAREYNGRLNEFKKRAQISYKLGLKRLIAKKEKKKEKGTIKGLEKEQQMFDQELNKDQDADKKHDELPVIRAYVVFERLEDRAKCLEDYKIKVRCCWRSRKQAPYLMFKKKYKLLVKPATDPSDILWENLEISHFQRVQRRVLGGFMTVPVMVASITIIIALKYFANGLPQTQDCKDFSINGNLSVEQAKGVYNETAEVFCYCKQQTLYEMAKEEDVGSFCVEYLKQQSLVSLIRFLGSSGVVFINLILKYILTQLSAFERTSTESKQKLQTMTRVFIALFINTALLTLLVNSNFQNNTLVESLPFKNYFLNGNYTDFTRDWYTDVGSTITLTLIVSVISPHFINLLFWFPLGCIKRKCCWKCYKSQITLNQMFAGPDFNIATRTAQVLTTFFSCFLFSGGMPILNIICFLTMLSIFWIDKTLILRHYRKPPFYSSAINDRIVHFLPFAVIFHCGFSLYAYGTGDIFPDVIQKTAPNTFVYAETVLVAERMYRYSGVINLSLIFLAGFMVVVKTMALTFWKRRSGKVLDEARLGQGTYSMELGRIREKGLHSYDIMENSVYRPLVISMDSAAGKVARLRGKENSVQVGVVEEELEGKGVKNEDNNVLIG